MYICVHLTSYQSLSELTASQPGELCQLRKKTFLGLQNLQVIL